MDNVVDVGATLAVALIISILRQDNCYCKNLIGETAIVVGRICNRHLSCSSFLVDCLAVHCDCSAVGRRCLDVRSQVGAVVGGVAERPVSLDAEDLIDLQSFGIFLTSSLFFGRFVIRCNREYYETKIHFWVSQI